MVLTLGIWAGRREPKGSEDERDRGERGERGSEGGRSLSHALETDSLRSLLFDLDPRPNRP